MEAELDQVDGRPIIGPERRLECLIAYGYDGTLLKDVTWSGPISGNVHRAYDSSFRVLNENVSGGTAVNFTYDNDDLLTDAGVMSVGRDRDSGFVASSTIGVINESHTYDAYGAEQTYTVTANGSTQLYYVNYGKRDELGRIVHKDETIQGQSHSFDYGYDANGRLIRVFNDGIAPGSLMWTSSATYSIGQLVTYNGVEYVSLQVSNTGRAPDTSSSWWSITQAYSYDQNGNRLTAPGLKSSPSYDSQDRLLNYGSCNYAYKADGLLQTKTCGASVTTYDYDAFSNLRRVTLPDGRSYGYLIDGQNRRVVKRLCANANCTTGTMVEGIVYENQLRPVAWLDKNGAVKATFVYGQKANVPEYMSASGVTYRMVVDQVGSVRLLINSSSGAVAEQVDYDEFGNAAFIASAQPFGFAGGLRDGDTGLTRFAARDYDPAIGRWTAKDPLRFGGGLGNLYAYVNADAVNATDPSGLSSYLCTKPLDLFDNYGGSGPGMTRSFSNSPWNPLFHEFICTNNGNASMNPVCGGLQSSNKKPLGWGAFSRDTFSGEQCLSMESPHQGCFDQCVLGAINGNRPPIYFVFGFLGGPVQNCQAWATDALLACYKKCGW